MIDADGGGPLEHARVSLEEPTAQGAEVVPLARSTVTDARGEFALDGIPAGRRSFLVAAYRHHMRILAGLEVVGGKQLGPLTIDLVATRDGEEPRLELAGIGAQLEATDDGARITRLLDGGGAAEAGLVVGDVVVAIDGARVVDLGFDQTIQRIRGPAETTVLLAVRRAADGRLVDIVVTRRRIRA